LVVSIPGRPHASTTKVMSMKLISIYSGLSTLFIIVYQGFYSIFNIIKKISTMASQTLFNFTEKGNLCKQKGKYSVQTGGSEFSIKKN